MVYVVKCSWFDTTENRGMRRHPSDLVDVSPRRQYAKYDPFVLPGNFDQACFIPYPWKENKKVATDESTSSSLIPSLAVSDSKPRRLASPTLISQDNPLFLLP
ncbi:hypothetical protein DY000_02055537 [Brassica cretica]|uniref:DUF4216 domain-containing protein n=1 Tax=Brassica cretica TaxID=69181 RepID=A0ABQ7AMM0_BRACR|nr:hypothetical protein DY000_02055537 [Brassica cretica]